jgi:hypothetical protein
MLSGKQVINFENISAILIVVIVIIIPLTFGGGITF